MRLALLSRTANNWVRQVSSDAKCLRGAAPAATASDLPGKSEGVVKVHNDLD